MADTGTISIRKGQIGKVLRFQTGIDVSGSSARILRWALPDGTTETRTGVPYDAETLTDLVYTTASGDFDDEGVYALEIEVQWGGGTKLLRTDDPITINVDSIT